MSENELRASRYIENFNPPYLIEKLVHKVCESVADAFLGQIEYGKDYVVRTELAKEDWADGYGAKYTYNLKFDKLVRCRDCRFCYKDRRDTSIGWVDVFVCDSEQWSTSSLMPSHKVEPNGYCAWGEPRESPDPSCDECGMKCIEKYRVDCPKAERREARHG